MNLPGLIAREILHRKGSFLLGAAGVALAAALVVAVAMTQEAAERETRRVTRDLGFNIRILPAAAGNLPEEALQRLAAPPGVSYNHLLGILDHAFEVRGVPVLLRGLSSEVSPPGAEKSPMILSVEPGTLHAGREAAASLGLEKGKRIELAGRSFTVARVLPESGTEDDRRLYLHLADAQRLLGLEGKLSEIEAIDCLCQTREENPLAILRSEVERVLPGARVLHLSAIADARARQRRSAERYAALAVPAALIVAAAWAGLLAWLNVRERGSEIGLLRALGHGSLRVAALFLGRAALGGLGGALLGWGLGTYLALRWGPEVFPVTAGAIHARSDLLLGALILAPIFSALAALPPAMAAAARDPAVALRAE